LKQSARRESKNKSSVKKANKGSDIINTAGYQNPAKTLKQGIIDDNKRSQSTRDGADQLVIY